MGTSFRLIVTDAFGRRTVPIDKPLIMIGRRSSSDLQLVSVNISREQAEISMIDGVCRIRDKGSRYGTFVNGAAVTEQVLSHGDVITFGRDPEPRVVFLGGEEVETASSSMRAPSDELSDVQARLRTATSGASLADALAAVLDAALDATLTERGYIIVADPEHELEVTAARGRGHVTLRARPALNEKVARQVLATGHTAILHDLFDPSVATTHQEAIALGIRSVVAVPLRLPADLAVGRPAYETVIGVMYLDSRDRAAPKPLALGLLGVLSDEAGRTLARAGLPRGEVPTESGVRIAADIPPDLAPEPPPVSDNVRFTVSAPAAARAGAHFLVDVWAHGEGDENEVARRARRVAGTDDIVLRDKGPFAVVRGTRLRLRLQGPTDVQIADPEETILWTGEIANASFPVSVHAKAAPGSRQFAVTVFIENISIAKLHFVITIAQSPAAVVPLPSRTQLYTTAFASYASEDRDDVLRILQGVQKAAPRLSIVIDVATLRSGQRWEEELWNMVPRQDVFYLFWSRAALASPWVNKEWRCALSVRGVDYIDPAPLEPPDIAPPPTELSELHFNDWTLAYLRRGFDRKALS